jgi:hypothetical protein
VARADAIFSRIMDRVRGVLDGLTQARSITSGVEQNEISVRDRLFAAVQSVFALFIQEIDQNAAMAVDVHRGEASARESLLRVIEDVRSRVAEGVDRQHAAEQQVQQNLASQRDRLLAQVQSSTGQVIEGQVKCNQLRQSNGEFLTNGMQRMIALYMEAKHKELQLRADQNAKEMEIIRYQIDQQHKMVVGFFGFQENRSDEYPSLDQLGKLCSQLGDTGASSWIQP